MTASIPGFAYQGLRFRGERLRVEQLEHGVARLVLARPERRNAFDAAMIAELSSALFDLSVLDPQELRVLLLAGEGSVFCAGADLAYMQAQAARSPEENLADARRLGAMFHRLAAFPAPVICAVQGAAMGGGFGLAACADLVLAEASAVFAVSEVRFGLVPALISPYVVRKLGVGRAAPLMLSGRRFEGAEAQALGLVHHVIQPGESMAALVSRHLGEWLKAGPEAARRTKALLMREAPLPDAELAEVLARAIAEVRGGAEAHAGLQAFFEKSAAPWVRKSTGKA